MSHLRLVLGGAIAAPQIHAPLILVVDDDPLVCRAMRRVLRRAGFDVVMAHDGQEALGFLSTTLRQVDVMLVDVVMPGLSGPEVLVAAEAMAPDTEIILMSGNSGGMLDDDGWSRADLVFLEKPVPAHVLVERVQRAVRRIAAQV